MRKEKTYGKIRSKKYKKNSIIGIWDLLKAIIISFALIVALLIIRGY